MYDGVVVYKGFIQQLLKGERKTIKEERCSTNDRSSSFLVLKERCEEGMFMMFFLSWFLAVVQHNSCTIQKLVVRQPATTHSEYKVESFFSFLSENLHTLKLLFQVVCISELDVPRLEYKWIMPMRVGVYAEGHL